MNILSPDRRRLVVVAVLVSTMLCGTVTVAVFSSRGAVDAVPASPVTIAAIGDSYTAGRNNQVVWPTLLAQRTGWAVANFALPDSGFAADGQGGHAFSYQVLRAQQVRPRAIVIMSGVTDAGYAFTGAVKAGTVDAVGKSILTGAQVLVVGPTWYELPVPAAVKAVADEIRAAAEEAGVPFLDALNPPWLAVDDMQSDLGGVTDEGQSVIADKVAAWLRVVVRT